MNNYQKEMVKGFSTKLLLEEANRCLLCYDASCSKSCPAGTDPAKFIRSVRFLNFKGGAETIRINNALGGICARVCPTERYCQFGCSRSGIDKPIDIGRIQRFLTDYEEATKMNILEAAPRNGKKIAVVGSGPSGIEAASYLARDGYEVTIYEKDSKLGGFLRYGIPEYRLPSDVVDREINKTLALGVKVKTLCEVGVDVKLEDLMKNNDAVILASGAGEGKLLPDFFDNKYVETAVNFLHRCKENQGIVELYDKVLVIGGGDVAMDTITSLKLIGVNNVVDVVYECFKEFKASNEELNHARDQKVSIIDGYMPTEVKDNEVTFKSRFYEGTLKIKADHIILAVGQWANVTNFGDLLLNKANEVKTISPYRIKDNLFVIGDLAEGDKTVVWGIKKAKICANLVENFVMEDK